MKAKIEEITLSLHGALDSYGGELAKAVPQATGCALIIIYMISFAISKSLWVLSLAIAALSLLGHIALQKVRDDIGKNEGRLWLKANIALAFACIGLIPYSAMSSMAIGTSRNLLIITVALSVLAALIPFFALSSDKGDELLKKLDDITFATAGGKQIIRPGDVVLCDNKELLESNAKDPREVIPFKDRFLHMLIIGPTGGGKTSQVILPMCHQDILNHEAGVTVLEPKGDLAREVAMMAEESGRPYMYFDPSVDNCPFFNPLIGDETEVIENSVTTFLALNPDSPQYFKDLSEQLVRYTLKVLKRLDKDRGIDGYYSTFIWMSRVLQNNAGQGRELVQKFSKIRSATPDEAKENADIASWFMNEYFAERSKVYENSSGIRSQVSKVISNAYLRHILNPDVEKGEFNQIDFDKHLEDGGVICISTCQSLLNDLGKFLGYFIILQFKSAVFRRPGNEDTRRAHFLYIDEFQTYSTPGFSDMLTQGRSYRVASHLATQARAQMAMGGGRDGKNFVELVSTNARNVVIFPGGSSDDAKYYSQQFGEYEKTEVLYSYTRKKFNPITGGFTPLGHPSESERTQSKMTPNFSPSEIIYRPFGEIVYCIIKNNSIQTPKVGKVKWLDKDYDAKLKQMIEDKIVVHEFRNLKDSSEAGQPNDKTTDFTWESETASESDTQKVPEDNVVLFDDQREETPQPTEPSHEAESLKHLVSEPLPQDDIFSGNDDILVFDDPFGDDDGVGDPLDGRLDNGLDEDNLV